MKKIYFTFLLLLLSGCFFPLAEPVNVEEDKFKDLTFICSRIINDYRTAVIYKLCRCIKADKSYEDYIHGVEEYGSPIKIEYTEAIDINKEKIKITSKDDRRAGMTINKFHVLFPEGYIHKNDEIEVKIYGESHETVLKIPQSTVMSLRDKIREIELNKAQK
jgi:hypothetical protein